MTVFGFDISNWQAGFSVGQAQREGYGFGMFKCTEGGCYRDPTWPVFRDEAIKCGLPFVAYHFARNSDNPCDQARLLASHVGDTRIPVMIDFEDTTIPAGVEALWGLYAAICHEGYRVSLSYVPHWYWLEHMGQGSLHGLPGLVASNYVTGSGYGSVLYQSHSPAQWASYGGNQPVIVQFSDSAHVAGYTIDVSAFEGPSGDLGRYFYVPGHPTGVQVRPGATA